MSVLTVKKLKKYFNGVRAVDGVSLSFEKGEIVSVIGPNGSGKTTLVDLLTGVVGFDHGVVVVRDVCFERMRPWDIASFHITRTFQRVRLFEQMTVLDNVLIVLTKRSVFSSLFERCAERYMQESEEVLQKVDLWGKRYHLASSLSYGQRKLLEVARALATRSDVYFFDEPFAGLFPGMVTTVSSVMRDLRSAGKTVVLIEHNMELIRSLSDRVVVLDGGRVLAEGSPDVVLSRQDVINAYMGVYE